MSTTRPYWSAALAALAAALGLALAGCREELGSVAFPTTRVSGVVREGGQPVSGGWIEFIPVDGTVGNLRSAPIARNGRFEVSQVAVGCNAIDVVHAPIRRPEVQWLLSTRGKPIRRAIPAGPATTLVIDLLTEAYRHEREQSDQATGNRNASTTPQPVAETETAR
jgi:hypothetical protein